MGVLDMVKLEKLDLSPYHNTEMDPTFVLKIIETEINSLIDAVEKEKAHSKYLEDTLKSLGYVVVDGVLDREKERLVQEFEKVKTFVES